MGYRSAIELLSVKDLGGGASLSSRRQGSYANTALGAYDIVQSLPA